MKQIVGWIKVIAINLVIFLVLLFLLNWSCGIYLKKADQGVRPELPNYASDPEYARAVFSDYHSIQHQYEPFVGWKMLPYHGKTTTINTDGNRTHISPLADDEAKQNIYFFGGSTMWGEGSDDAHTIPALVNKSLPERAVYNYAQLAYNTRQELDALITFYSKKDKADLVVFYDGVNDAAFLCPSEINRLPSHRLVPLFRQKLYVQRSAVVKEMFYKTFLDNILKVVNSFSNKENQASPYDCLSESGKAEEIAEIMLRNWELAHEIVTSRGGGFIAVLQPAAFIGNPRTDHLMLDADFAANFSEVYRLIKIKIKERNHPWIYDLSDAFDGNEYIYIDFCHVSPNGNEIMANKIYEIINRSHGK